jgi:hypothetical protein
MRFMGSLSCYKFIRVAEQWEGLILVKLSASIAGKQDPPVWNNPCGGEEPKKHIKIQYYEKDNDPHCDACHRRVRIACGSNNDI